MHFRCSGGGLKIATRAKELLYWLGTCRSKAGAGTQDSQHCKWSNLHSGKVEILTWGAAPRLSILSAGIGMATQWCGRKSRRFYAHANREIPMRFQERQNNRPNLGPSKHHSNCRPTGKTNLLYSRYCTPTRTLTWLLAKWGLRLHGFWCLRKFVWPFICGYRSHFRSWSRQSAWLGDPYRCCIWWYRSFHWLEGRTSMRHLKEREEKVRIGQLEDIERWRLLEILH